MKQWLLNITNFFKRYLSGPWVFILFLLVIGLLLSLTARMQISAIVKKNPISFEYELHNSYWPLIKDLGMTIIGAGFFTAFLKVFQFMGVFQDAIKTVFNNDNENIIQTQLGKALLNDDLILHHKSGIQNLIFCGDGLPHLHQEAKTTIWKNITKNLYPPDLGDLDKEIANELYLNFIPKSVDFYQKDYKVVYDISLINDKNIQLTQTASFKIITCSDDVQFNASYFVWKTNAPHDLGSVTIKNIKIDRVSYNKEIVTEPEEKKEDYIILNQSFAINLPRKKEYEIETIVNFVHCIDLNPYWRFALNRFTDGFEIITRYDKTKIIVNIELLDDRLEQNFKDIFTSYPENGKKIEKLLLPSDGYIIITNPKL